MVFTARCHIIISGVDKSQVWEKQAAFLGHSLQLGGAIVVVMVMVIVEGVINS